LSRRPAGLFDCFRSAEAVGKRQGESRFGAHRPPPYRPQPYRQRRLPRLLAFLALATLLGCKELGIQAEPPPTSTGPSTAGLMDDPTLKHWQVPQSNTASAQITNPKQAPIGPAPTGRNSPLSQPVIYQVAAATPPATGSAPPITVNGGDKVMLNFVGADVHEVVSSVLGDTLKINYSIDPKVTGTVTFRTMSPIPKADLLGLLEDMLALSGAAMVARRRL